MIVELKNYQSIIKGKIEIKGLTALVAQNNQGKTAIIRAIQDFACNSFSKEKIHKDEKESTITINGITLKRTIPTTTLIQNGVETVKLEGKNIVQLTGNKDFLIIDNDKIKEFLIQFSLQREALPPFDLTNSQLYYLFSMMFDMETLNKLFLHYKETVKENESELKYLKGKTDEILKQKLRIEEIETKLPSIERLNKLEYKYTGISSLLSNILRKESIEEELLKLNKIKQTINPKVFQKYKLISLLDRINKIYQIKKTIELYNVSLLCLKIRLMKSIKDKYKANQSILLSYLLTELDKKKTLQQKNSNEIMNHQAELNKFKVCPLCGK